MWISIKMYQKLLPSMPSFPIIYHVSISTSISTSINTSPIVASAEKNYRIAIFQTCYEKLLKINASILYLNKIKRLALSFTTEAHAIHLSTP
jgi:hypothetical protein